MNDIKSSHLLYGFGGVLLLILLIYLIEVWRKRPKPIEIDGSQVPEGYDASVLSNKLADALKPWSLDGYYKNEVLGELYNLPNDEMFKLVYKTFNEAHGEGETLRDWISSEWVGSSIFQTDYFNLVLNKIEDLNLA